MAVNCRQTHEISKEFCRITPRDTAIFNLTSLPGPAILNPIAPDIATGPILSLERTMKLELPECRILGPTAALVFPATDEITPRLMMLVEGQCEGLGAAAAALKHG